MPSEAKGDRDRVLVTDTDLVRVTDTLGDLDLGFLDRDKVRVTEPVRERVIVGLRVRVTEPVLLTVRVQGSVPCVFAGVLDRVLVTDTDLVRVTDTLGDLVLGFLDRDMVRVTEPVRETVRVQGSVPCVFTGVRERVLVTEVVLVRVTDTVGLLVRVLRPVGSVLVTEGDLELGSLVFERVMVTDLVRVTELVRERVTVVERVRVGLPVLDVKAPTCTSHRRARRERNLVSQVIYL